MARPACCSARTATLRIKEESSTINVRSPGMAYSQPLLLSSLAVNSQGFIPGAWAAAHLASSQQRSSSRWCWRRLVSCQHCHTEFEASSLPFPSRGDDSCIVHPNSNSASRMLAASEACGPSLDLSLIHISEPTRRTPISYAVFCLKKKKK